MGHLKCPLQKKIYQSAQITPSASHQSPQNCPNNWSESQNTFFKSKVTHPNQNGCIWWWFKSSLVVFLNTCLVSVSTCCLESFSRTPLGDPPKNRSYALPRFWSNSAAQFYEEHIWAYSVTENCSGHSRGSQPPCAAKAKSHIQIKWDVSGGGE